MARAHSSTGRHQILNYLGEHLPVSKGSIVSKLRVLRVQKEEQKLKKVQYDLKTAIDEAMKNALKYYNMELKRIADLRSAAQATATSKGLDKPEQQYKNPRRKFPWSNSIRYAFCIAQYEKYNNLSFFYIFV